MFEFGRPHGQGQRSGFVVVLLLLTLGLAGVLAYEAQKAARSHRAAAASALEDHATFVAWQFADRAESKLDHLVISRGLWWVRAANGEVWDSTAAGGMAAEDREAAAKHLKKRPPFIRYSFRMDLRDGGLEICEGVPPGRAVRRWLADTLAVHSRTEYRPEWSFATVAGAPDGRSHVLFYMVELDATEHPVRALGFEVDPAALPVPFGYAFEYALLPPTLTDSASNAEVLSVRVMGPAGDTLFASRPTYPAELSAIDRFGLQYGSLPVEVALRPEVADRLIIGGLPRSRLPLLVGLLFLAGGLVAAAIFLLRREAEFARLRGEFVSNVSHELRTPLAQIRMFAETLILGRVRSDGERRRALEIIDQEARRLTNLVGNILLFSRSDRNGTRLSIEPLELVPLLREVVDGFRPLAEARGVELRTELEEGVRAPADRSALQQVVLNFLDNAVKYGPPGQTVTLGLGRAGDRVRIWVEDQGPGIPPEDRERVWAPFSRLERERVSAAAGTGIGLSVVRDLVSRHSGRAWVEDGEDGEDGGARFVVELPAAERARRGNGDRAADGRARAGREGGPGATPEAAGRLPAGAAGSREPERTRSGTPAARRGAEAAGS